MSVYKTEEEQIDDLKRWIKSYGPSILTGVLLAIVLLFGWRYWKNYQHERATQASVLYQQAVDAYETKHLDLLNQFIHKLKEKYPKSPYASYAVFLQIKLAADQKNYQAAETGLSWIIAHNRDENITSIAKLRLGSVQTADHQAQQAIETLQSIKNPAFQGLADIKIADAYLTLGDQTQAKTYYETASKLLPDASNTMPTLAVKLDGAAAT